jgi:hypothetical protein
VVESVIRDEVSVAEPRGDELAATGGEEQGEVGFGPRTEGADLAAADLSATEDGGQDILDRLVLVNDGERIEVAVVSLLADGGTRLHVGDPLHQRTQLGLAARIALSAAFALELGRVLERGFDPQKASGLASAGEVQPLAGEVAEISGMLYTLRRRVATDG